MIPSVGRIVHYQSFGTPGGEYASKPRAAIITEATEIPDARIIQDGQGLLTDEQCFRVALCILNPTGQFFNVDVSYSPDPRPGCWSWPPRA